MSTMSRCSHVLPSTVKRRRSALSFKGREHQMPTDGACEECWRIGGAKTPTPKKRAQQLHWGPTYFFLCGVRKYRATWLRIGLWDPQTQTPLQNAGTRIRNRANNPKLILKSAPKNAPQAPTPSPPSRTIDPIRSSRRGDIDADACRHGRAYR